MYVNSNHDPRMGIAWGAIFKNLPYDKIIDKGGDVLGKLGIAKLFGFGKKDTPTPLPEVKPWEDPKFLIAGGAGAAFLLWLALKKK